jgi:hypothetical protein
MSEPQGPSQDRLDSWKAIAEYLQRDVATVRRWEKSLGLPIRRVPGGPGRSVFAYASEIDAWLKATPQPGGATQPEAPSDAAPSRVTIAQARGARRWAVALGLGLLGVTGIVLFGRAYAIVDAPAKVVIEPAAVVALDRAGGEQWRHRFAPEVRAVVARQKAPVLSGASPGVLAATAYYTGASDPVVTGGELMSLTLDGQLSRRFSFDESVAFGAASYGAPWVLTDFSVDEATGARRIAVAAHHLHWWPSVVTVLDERWQRRGTFVNAGWIDWVNWLPSDRLVITGFSNAKDGGMVALLDARAMDGQSPADAGSDYHCTACGPASPIRYVVLPRSEVNRVSASPFNHAVLERSADRMIVRTIEMPLVTHAVDAVYEFTPSLELVRAAFSDRYWEMHASLEQQGKISHTRAQCPDRDGPREVEVWEPQTGWRKVSVRRP